MDTIIINSKIVTLDQNSPIVEAIAIRDGIIIEMGTNEQMLTLKTNTTEVIDLKGKLMLPGFNDSHMHLLGLGSNLHKIDLVNTKSIEEIIIRAKEYLNKTEIPPGYWVQGRGWNHHLFPTKEMPTRYDLDQISTQYPVILLRVCGHVASVNSKALELLGIIDDNVPTITGGHIDVDTDRKPLGIFRENAMQLIYDRIPEPGIAQLKEWIQLAAKIALENGITSVQTDDFVVVPQNYQKVLEAYESLVDLNQLPIRVYEQSNLPKKEQLIDFLESGLKTGIGNSFFKIGPLKLLTDGSLGARTALLKEPYTDDPTTNGISVFSPEELNELVCYATQNGMQVALHAIGDKAIEGSMEAIEIALSKYSNGDHRHAIIHCQITNHEIMNRMKELNIIGLVQPLFVSTDLHFVEERIGPIRAKTSYSWKTMLEKGIPIAFGSDAPVESLNVLHGIYAAVTRKDIVGFPENGWLPEQRLTVKEAVYAYTLGAAYAAFEEHVKGSITPGKFADLVVLSEDIFEIDSDKIKDTFVEKTFVDGKLVYEK